MTKIKTVIFYLIVKLLSFYKIFKLKNVILIESMPVYSDNSKYVFDELIKRGYNRKYKFYWINNENEELDLNIDNVYYINLKKGNVLCQLFSFVKLVRLEYIAKGFIVCNKFLTKFRSDQFYIDLAHGAALKNCSGHYNLPKNVDYVCTLSDYLAEYDAINFNCDKSKIIPLGYARNDLLFGATVDLKELFEKYSFEKVIYWLPTYRQHKNGRLNSSSVSFPIIYNESIANEINTCAKKSNVFIIIKSHPAQQIDKLIELKLSNLIFIDNDFLLSKGVDNYSLLKSVDALITDYSSVYYDYLLCDKPIGLCFDDFEEYNSNEGFTVNPEFILAGGEKIYNSDDLCRFIYDISSSKDNLKDKRNELKKLCHKHIDGNATERVTEFIIKNLEN